MNKCEEMDMIEKYDKIIIGAGIYGMYAAKKILEKKPDTKVLIIEVEKEPFNRGSYINQARLHNGYHYPRSYSTASKSARYFNRFYNDFKEGINDKFKKVYAVASDYSWTNGEQFQKFCDNLNVKCEEIPKRKYFNKNTIDKAFLTKEFSFDSKIIGKMLYEELIKLGCNFKFDSKIVEIKREEKEYVLKTLNKEIYSASFVLNATYAGINKIHDLLGFEYLPIKYEFCEVILCEVSDNIKNVGLTVMDGPFFSLMPFGLTGYHSITTVSRTPHSTNYEKLHHMIVEEMKKKRNILSIQKVVFIVGFFLKVHLKKWFKLQKNI